VKLLLDTCVWGGARLHLEGVGHDTQYAGDWPIDPGDEEILARAYADGRVLVALDKDFGELAIVHGRRHVGIVRLVEIPARMQAAVCAAVLSTYADILMSGGIVTA
jgi:predicted nuclease of predicted toxin-antitoxin system